MGLLGKNKGINDLLYNLYTQSLLSALLYVFDKSRTHYNHSKMHFKITEN